MIGGGVSGLARAYALMRAGEEVVLVERSARAGGVVRTVLREGFLLEMGPNTVRPTPALWSLARELGLAGNALFADARLPRYVDFGGRLHPVPLSPGGFFGSRLLSLPAKVRVFGEPFVGRGAAGETVRSFFARRFGRQIAERLIEPFVSGIWAGDAGRLEAETAFPALARFEREHGSILVGALAAARRRTKTSSAERPPRGLLSFQDGLETLPRAIAGALGPRLRLGTPVESIERSSGGWRVVAAGAPLEAERVVLATPAEEAAALVREIDPAAARALAEIPHPPLAVLHLSWPEDAFPRPLHGFGQLTASSSAREILGAVWSSSLFAGRAPEGQALLTVFLGGARDPSAASRPDEELMASATRDLEASLGVRGSPRPVSVAHYPRALPQYEVGHSARLEALADAEKRLPGITFLGNYRGGVSVGDVVKNALAIG